MGGGQFRQPARTVALVLALAAAYVLLGRLAFSLSVQHGNITSVVFVPEGLALGFAIAFGIRVIPGVLIGQTLLSIWSGPSVLGGFAIGSVNCLEAMLGVWLFRRLHISSRLDRPRDSGLLIALIFLVLQPISATGGVGVLYLLGVIPESWVPQEWAPWWIRGIQTPLPTVDLVPSAWFSWWIGNSMGQLLVAPLILVWSVRASHPRAARREIVVSVAAIAGLVVLATGVVPVHPIVVLAATYPVLVWVGVKLGVRGLVLGNAVLAPPIIWAGSTGDGLLTGMAVDDRIAYVSFFIASACIVSLLVSALLEERGALTNELALLARTDHLTGLGNRRDFIEKARAELGAGPSSLILVDIDHFKAVNDEFGHVAGDGVIRDVAALCRRELRPTDVAARFGGEEFAFLLPDTRLAAAATIAERMVNAVAAEPFTIEGTAIAVTVSVGVAAGSYDGDIDALVRKADDAMYDAKHDGRNRVSVAR